MSKKRKTSTEDRLQRKIRKYEEKLQNLTRRSRPLLTPSPPPHSPTPPTPPPPVPAKPAQQEDQDQCQDDPIIIPESDPSCVDVQEEETLDEDILNLLGDAPDEQKFGPSIHKELASRWTSIIKNGLSKENRAEIKKKYLPPHNCKMLDAPKLNLEAEAAVPEIAVKRDKAIAIKQNQIGCALTALARAFGDLIKNKENLQSINFISDAARLLCDHQHQESMTRRNFILQGLEQTTKDSIRDAEIDQWLFGESFSEKLKASRAIKRSGQEITINRSKKPQQQTTKKSLNFRGPVKNLPRRGIYQAGPQRTYQNYKTQQRPTTTTQLPKTYMQNKAPLKPFNSRK